MWTTSSDSDAVTRHLDNVAENLQLIADLAYGDVALAVAREDGSLSVVADARPMTAVAAMASSRVGRNLARREEPEAYEALTEGRAVRGARRRSTRGIAYVTSAFPVGDRPVGVVILDVTLQAVEAPGRMEREFIDLSDSILGVLGSGPLRDVTTGGGFSTTRKAGDGVLSLGPAGLVDYASPNAVNIMRGAGHDRVLTEEPAKELPGAPLALGPLGSPGDCVAVEIAAGGRVLSYRSIRMIGRTLVLVEDVTDVRSREQELKVKDATIREVHHRVKNNLQTIASLLRIQARRSGSDEASHALREAEERISSMAVVHEQLTGSDDERVDFADSARIIGEMVRSSIGRPDASLKVVVEGSTGEIPAQVATSMALVTAELVHNAIEHGIGSRERGTVTVELRRLPGEVKLVVRDDGGGLGPDFDPDASANLGLAIVKTVVEDDLRGTLTFSSGRGTCVTIRVPVDQVIEPGATASAD
jgi:two-component sensor histidine kinase